MVVLSSASFLISLFDIADGEWIVDLSRVLLSIGNELSSMLNSGEKYY